MDRFTYISAIVLLLFLASCNLTEGEESKFKILYTHEDLTQAKADWPGLFVTKDTTLIIISLVGSEGYIDKQFIYKGSNDTIWTEIIKERELNEHNSKDTIIRTLDVTPILPDTTLFAVYFMNGFGSSEIIVKNKGQVLFKGQVESFKTWININKKDLGELEIITDNKSAVLEIKRNYNFIELIKRDSILKCNQRYYVPLE